MQRRTFLVALGGSLFTAPTTSLSQPTRVPTIGFLGNVPGKSSDAFRAGLRDLGWLEGKNIQIQYRWIEGNPDRYPTLAAELIGLNVELIVTASTPAIQAVQGATPILPIVMASSADAVRTGLVASLSRPGGHTTGLTILIPELSAKRLEVLKQAVPKVSRVGVLWNAAGPAGALALKDTELAARQLALEIVSAKVQASADLEAAFVSLVKARTNALYVVEGPVLINLREAVVKLAAKHRLPSIAPLREFAEAGGLIAYGPSLADMFRRAATYVDKILRGAKPADIPVEQPTKFELVINLKTAQTLGLTIPQSLLLRADEVIR